MDTNIGLLHEGYDLERMILKDLTTKHAKQYTEDTEFFPAKKANSLADVPGYQTPTDPKADAIGLESSSRLTR